MGFYGRMDKRNGGKQRLASLIMSKKGRKDTIVVDIGAGSCVIGKMLLDAGFEGEYVAIDRLGRHDDDRIRFIRDDAFLALLRMTEELEGKKRVSFVLSAVLHEMTKLDMDALAQIIKEVGTKTKVDLYIREPTITPRIANIAPIPYKYDKDFREYRHLNRMKGWQTGIMALNYAFAKSYGPQSWKREKNEGRFTYEEYEIKRFIRRCGCSLVREEREKDPFYEKTLPCIIYERLPYTSVLFEGRGGKETHGKSH